jgi:TolB protein
MRNKLLLIIALVFAHISAGCSSAPQTDVPGQAASPSPTSSPIPATATPTAVPQPPLSASGGGVLAFVSHRSGRPGIYVMNADGSDQRLVTDVDNAADPSFSPDGARILYRTSAPNMGTISTINIDGSGHREIFSQNRAMGAPDWSQERDEIVFIFHTHAYFSISVMEADGGNFRQLTTTVVDQINDSPDWSPDGEQIVFSSDRSGDHEIFVMDADGSNVQQLTDNEATDYYPAWSPDGTQIAFTSDRDGNWEIYVMDADGGNVRRLTNDPAKDWDATWSPDGTRLAFASRRDGNWEIYIMNADGSDPQRITDNPAQESDPVWRPD